MWIVIRFPLNKIYFDGWSITYMVIGMQCINSSVRSVDLCGLTRPILSWRDTSRLLLNVSDLPGMTGRKNRLLWRMYDSFCERRHFTWSQSEFVPQKRCMSGFHGPSPQVLSQTWLRLVQNHTESNMRSRQDSVTEINAHKHTHT